MRLGEPEKSAPPLDFVSIRVHHLGPARVREAIQLAWKWHRRGIGPNAILALTDLYVERAGKIANAFRLFNPGSAHFGDLCESAASRLSEAEGQALKALDGEAARRDRLRAESAARALDRTREPEPTP